jgi:hypothetical protein
MQLGASQENCTYAEGAWFVSSLCNLLPPIHNEMKKCVLRVRQFGRRDLTYSKCFDRAANLVSVTVPYVDILKELETSVLLWVASSFQQEFYSLFGTSLGLSYVE